MWLRLRRRNVVIWDTVNHQVTSYRLCEPGHRDHNNHHHRHHDNHPVPTGPILNLSLNSQAPWSPWIRISSLSQCFVQLSFLPQTWITLYCGIRYFLPCYTVICVFRPVWLGSRIWKFWFEIPITHDAQAVFLSSLHFQVLDRLFLSPMALTIAIIRIWIWRTRANRLHFFSPDHCFPFIKSFVLRHFGAEDLMYTARPYQDSSRNRDTIYFFPVFCIESRSRSFSCINIFEYPPLLWLLVFRKSGISKQAKERNYNLQGDIEVQQGTALQISNVKPLS